MDKIVAPWTVEQVLDLNHWQHSGLVHPYTCGHCRDTHGTHYVVERMHVRPATEDEWEAARAEIMAGLDAEDPMSYWMVKRDRFTVIDHSLVATVNGWICPTCDYTQDWAHAF